MQAFVAFVHSPLAHSVLFGWLGAAGADIHTLVAAGQSRGWSALKDFNWNTASFRWLIGAGVGLLGGLGFNMAGIQ